MDARHRILSLAIRYSLMVAIGWAGIATTANSASAQDIRTENFIVSCSDYQFAHQVGEEAERLRRELSLDWLGHELGPWREKIPIEVKFSQYASGMTRFGFAPTRSGKGYPVSWEMVVEGPRDRILDAVLPHEITHAVFATHFGQPLPRWADEGACTTVEHEGERKKHKVMLVEFLMTKRGIPFNRMFRMMQYPNDMLPLYAQGHSVADFLIQHRGRRAFVDYVDEALKSGMDWDRVTRQFYGYEDLSDLQITWNEWVRLGSQSLDGMTGKEKVASLTGQSLSGEPTRSLAERSTDAYDQLAQSSNHQGEFLDARQQPMQPPSRNFNGGGLQFNGPRDGVTQLTPINSSPGNGRATTVNEPVEQSDSVSGESWYFAVKRQYENGNDLTFAEQGAYTPVSLQQEITYRAQLRSLHPAIDTGSQYIIPYQDSDRDQDDSQTVPIHHDALPARYSRQTMWR